MIVVTVGTNEARFDRLLAAVEALGEAEPVLVQHGPSAIRPANAECVAFLPFDELVERMRAARCVVTHAGVGSVMVALSVGHRPIVVPRLRAHGEAVDDHQVPLARRLAGAGLVTLAERLPDDLVAAAARGTHGAEGTVGGASALAADLRAYLGSLLAGRDSGDQGAAVGR